MDKNAGTSAELAQSELVRQRKIFLKYV